MSKLEDDIFISPPVDILHEKHRMWLLWTASFPRIDSVDRKLAIIIPKSLAMKGNVRSLNGFDLQFDCVICRRGADKKNKNKTALDAY